MIPGALVVRADYAKEQPQNVARFLAVYLRAWKWMNAHQPEAIAMMKKFYDVGGVTISEASMKKELWKGHYAATNHKEYWAEGVQSYFDCNAPAGGVHNDINTRDKLAKYEAHLDILRDLRKRQSGVNRRRTTCQVRIECR